METKRAIDILKCFQEPEAWEKQITEEAFNALQMAIDVLSDEGDTISRKGAIDAVKRLSLGETDATRLAMRIGEYLERLSSAQSQIIRCKECRHRDEFGCCKYWVGLTMGMPTTATDDDDFCSHAERRTE